MKVFKFLTGGGKFLLACFALVVLGGCTGALVSVDMPDMPDRLAFVAVRDISIPTESVKGGSIVLDDAIVSISPSNASNKNIVWKIPYTGQFTAIISRGNERNSYQMNAVRATINGNNLNTANAGLVLLKATIPNGLAEGKDYEKTFYVNVRDKRRGAPESPTLTFADLEGVWRTESNVDMGPRCPFQPNTEIGWYIFSNNELYYFVTNDIIPLFWRDGWLDSVLIDDNKVFRNDITFSENTEGYSEGEMDGTIRFEQFYTFSSGENGIQQDEEPRYKELYYKMLPDSKLKLKFNSSAYMTDLRFFWQSQEPTVLEYVRGLD